MDTLISYIPSISELPLLSSLSALPVPAKAFLAALAGICLLSSAGRAHNHRGSRLWFGALPTADLRVSMKGKKVIITGANAGIGAQIAAALLGQGATVFLACRNTEKAKQALDEVILPLATKIAIDYKHTVGTPTIMQVDLASFQSIRSFVEKYSSLHSHLDVLINNAGLLTENTAQTVDGYPDLMGVNYFGTYLLTSLLLPLLQKEAWEPSRIVVVSSKMHGNGPEINVENLGCKGYSMMKAYATSKLALIMMANSFAEKLKNQKGRRVLINSVHPGFIKTTFDRDMSGYAKTAQSLAAWLFAMTPWQGAQNTIHLATSPLLVSTSGLYFEHFTPMETIPNSQSQHFISTRDLLWDQTRKELKLSVDL